MGEDLERLIGPASSGKDLVSLNPIGLVNVAYRSPDISSAVRAGLCASCGENSSAYEHFEWRKL